MKKTSALLAAALAFAPFGRAQYTPPSPAVPVPGLIDESLRAADATFGAWDIGVNERVRFEDKDGAGTTHAGSNYDFFAASPTSNTNDYWLSRLMPRIAYTQGFVSAVAEGRSSYSWGDDRFNPAAPGRALADNDGPAQLELGYLLIGDLKTFPLQLKIGRQELTYGDQRLLGSAMWLNVPHTFDAAKIRYQGKVDVDLFAGNLVYSRGDHFDRSNSQDTLSGAYFDFPAISQTQLTEAYVLARNVARGIVTDDWTQVAAPFRFPAPQDLYTVGFRTKTKPTANKAWDYGIEAMGQFGNRTAVFAGTSVPTAEAAPRLSQSAWAFVAQAGYTWKPSHLQPRLALIISAASGDKNAADNQSETFQNLLPSNHGLYGAMDLTGLQNIEDLRLNYSIKPTSRITLAADLHSQRLETTSDYWYNAAGVPRSTPGAAPGSGRGFGLNPSYSKDLGREADLTAGWNPTRGILAEAGYSHFFRGRYIDQSLAAVGARDASYFYFQTILNF